MFLKFFFSPKENVRAISIKLAQILNKKAYAADKEDVGSFKKS